jgi:REP element-mobilizing transposase RayT
MPRKPRVHFKGALYHVIVRGNNKDYIFSEEKDKKEYLNVIKRYKDKYNFILYAYCIMDNHAHLLIEVKDTPLSKIMQGIQQVYTQRYNIRKNRTGHVFEQRYKALLCNKDKYLIELIRYIHQNPLKAGLKKGIKYKWSSHNEYMGAKKITDIEYPLSIFSSNKTQSKKIYLKYVMNGEEVEEANWEKEVNEEIAIERKFDKKNHKGNIDPEQLMLKVGELSGTGINEIYGNSRNRKISDIRKILVKLLHKYTNLNNKEIAIRLGIGESTVTNILNGRYKNSESINEFIENVIKELKL